MSADNLASLVVRDAGIREERLAEALRWQVMHGGQLDTALQEMGLLDESTLLTLLAKAFGLAAVGRDVIDRVDKDTVAFFPRRLAEKYGVVPIAHGEGRLVVAVTHSPDFSLLEEISEVLRAHVQPVVTTELRMNYALYRLYGAPLMSRMENLLGLLGEDPEEIRSLAFVSEEKTSFSSMRSFNTGPRDALATQTTSTSQTGHFAPVGMAPVSAAPSYTASGLSAAESAGAASISPVMMPSLPTHSAQDLAVRQRREAVRARLLARLEAEENAERHREEERRNQRVSWAVDDVIAELALAENRDAMLDIVLRFAYRKLRTAAIFIIQRQPRSDGSKSPVFVGWDIIDPALSREDIVRLTIPVDGEHVLGNLWLMRSHYLGPLREDDPLRVSFGQSPRAVLLVPILVGEHLIGALYGDGGDHVIPPASLAELQMVVPRLGKALGNLIVRKRHAAKPVTPFSEGASQTGLVPSLRGASPMHDVSEAGQSSASVSRPQNDSPAAWQRGMGEAPSVAFPTPISRSANGATTTGEVFSQAPASPPVAASARNSGDSPSQTSPSNTPEVSWTPRVTESTPRMAPSPDSPSSFVRDVAAVLPVGERGPEQYLESVGVVDEVPKVTLRATANEGQANFAISGESVDIAVQAESIDTENAAKPILPDAAAAIAAQDVPTTSSLNNAGFAPFISAARTETQNGERPPQIEQTEAPQRAAANTESTRVERIPRPTVSSEKIAPPTDASTDTPVVGAAEVESAASLEAEAAAASDDTVAESSAVSVVAPSDDTDSESSAASVAAPSDDTVAESSAVFVVAPSDDTDAESSSASVAAPSDDTDAESSSAAVVAPSEAAVASSPDVGSATGASNPDGYLKAGFSLAPPISRQASKSTSNGTVSNVETPLAGHGNDSPDGAWEKPAAESLPVEDNAEAADFDVDVEDATERTVMHQDDESLAAGKPASDDLDVELAQEHLALQERVPEIDRALERLQATSSGSFLATSQNRSAHAPSAPDEDAIDAPPNTPLVLETQTAPPKDQPSTHIIPAALASTEPPPRRAAAADVDQADDVPNDAPIAPFNDESTAATAESTYLAPKAEESIALDLEALSVFDPLRRFTRGSTLPPPVAQRTSDLPTFVEPSHPAHDESVGASPSIQTLAKSPPSEPDIPNSAAEEVVREPELPALQANVPVPASASSGSAASNVYNTIPDSPGEDARESSLLQTWRAWLDASDAEADHRVTALEGGNGIDDELCAWVCALQARSAAALARSFPGKLTMHPFGSAAVRPSVSELSEVCACLVEMGPTLAAPILVGELSHEDRMHRFAAVWSLSELYVPAAVPSLAQRLFDREMRLARIALEVLGRYRKAPAFTSVLERLRDLCRRGDHLQRSRSIEALTEFRDRYAVDALVGLLGTRPETIAEEARQALVTLTCQDFRQSERRWRAWYADHGQEPRTRWLIDALHHKSAELRKLAQDELYKITGQDFGYDAEAPRRAREAAAKIWLDWWRVQGANAWP